MLTAKVYRPVLGHPRNGPRACRSVWLRAHIGSGVPQLAADQIQQQLIGKPGVAAGVDQKVDGGSHRFRHRPACPTGAARCRLRDDGAVPPSGFNEASRLEFLVGAPHRSGGDAQIGGQATDGGQPASGGERSGGDKGADLRADLLIRRGCGTQVHGDTGVHRAPSRTGFAGVAGVRAKPLTGMTAISMPAAASSAPAQVVAGRPSRGGKALLAVIRSTPPWAVQ